MTRGGIPTWLQSLQGKMMLLGAKHVTCLTSDSEMIHALVSLKIGMYHRETSEYIRQVGRCRISNVGCGDCFQVALASFIGADHNALREEAWKICGQRYRGQSAREGS